MFLLALAVAPGIAVCLFIYSLNKYGRGSMRYLLLSFVLGMAATLPAPALRYLFQHSGVHLNAEWRDLPDECWKRTVQSLDGRSVRIDATPLMRAREIWKAAATLDGSWRSSDIPAAMSGPSDSARPSHDGAAETPRDR